MHRHPIARIGFLLAGLATFPAPAGATVHTRAEYTVWLSAVADPNSPQTNLPGATDSQVVYGPHPPTITMGGGAEHSNVGYGYASGYATAVAAPGILRVNGSTEAQAVARPDTNVGASVSALASAEFADELTFTWSRSVYDDLLIVDGELILSGDMSSAGSGGGGYVMVAVGGTGLSQTSRARPSGSAR